MGEGGDSQVCHGQERGKGARATGAPPAMEAKPLLTGQATKLGPREGRDLTWTPSHLYTFA